MDSMQTEIARFLAEKAMRQTRATYQQVGDAVGWNHPTGRGLGKNLEVILHALHDRGLPPLTTILVKRGERHPAPDAMSYIRGALGDIDIEAAQREVFSFDWGAVPDLAPDGDRLPAGRDLWLTSFWGFDPASWGCIGFADEAKTLLNSQPKIWDTGADGEHACSEGADGWLRILSAPSPLPRHRCSSPISACLPADSQDLENISIITIQTLIPKVEMQP